MSEPAEQITFDDFLKVDIRVGTVVEASPFPGGAQARRSSSPSISAPRSAARNPRRRSRSTTRRRCWSAAQVAAVVNFPPRQIGKFMSEVLTLGFPDAGGEVVLITPSLPVPNGGRMF